MDASAAKKLVATKVGRTLNQTDWQALEDAGRWNAFSDAFDDQDIAEAVAFFRIPADGMPPADWPARSKRVFEQFAHTQADALALFGLKAPLSWAELEQFLVATIENEPVKGDRGLVEYAVPADPWRRLLVIWRGMTSEESMDHATVNDLAWIVANTNRLWKVVESARRIANITGCDVSQVVVYLLCGLTPLLPWVSVSTHTMWSEELGNATRYTIEVGSPDVPLDAVRDAYRRARDANLGETLSIGKPAARRRASKRTQELLSFCDEFGAGTSRTWADAYAEWCEVHRHWPYKNAASLEHAYRNAKERETQWLRQQKGGE